MNWFTKTHLKDKSWSEQPLRFRFYVELLNFGRRLRHLLYLHWFELLLYPIMIFTAWVLLGCTRIIEPTDVVEPEDLVDIAEAYCEANPLWPCGQVYVCDGMLSSVEGNLEICLTDDLPLEVIPPEYGSCVPTPRHVGLCWWCCGGTCGPGCNAYDGCYCPPEPPPMPMPEEMEEVFPHLERAKDWL